MKEGHGVVTNVKKQTKNSLHSLVKEGQNIACISPVIILDRATLTY